MRKRIITLVIILCVLIIAVLAGVLLRDYEAPSETATPGPTLPPDESEAIFDFNVDDAVQLSLKAPEEEELVFNHEVKTEIVNDKEEKTDIWTFATDESFKLDNVEVSTLFGVVSDLRGTKLEDSVVEGATLKDFGLDTPTVVTVTMKDDTKHIIEVGNFTTLGNSAYAKLPGDIDDIYLIGYGESLYLTSKKVDFMNKSLFALPQNDAFDSITVKDNGKLRFKIESNEIEDVNESDAATGNDQETIYNWKAVEPIKWDVNLGDVTLFVDMFDTISASEVVEDATDLKKYGLENPKYELLLEHDGHEYRLALGNKDESGNFYYGTWDDNKYIYSFSTQVFTEIDIELNNVINQIPYGPSYADLSKLEIMLDGKDYTFNIVQSDQSDIKSDVFEYNGREFSESANPDLTSAFRKIYKGVLGLWANDIDVDTKPAENAEVDIRFIFTNEVEKETVTVEYVKKNEVQYYVLINGEYTGVLSNISNTNVSIDELIPGIRTAIKSFLELYSKL